jgi:hypothetical protein
MSEEVSAQQFGRAVSLIVFGKDLDGLDLSELRIKFSVKRSDTMTPNTADIRVYNLEEKTAIRVRDEFKNVILQAGYEGNKGVIFKGNIKQVILGRESATDTFIDIIAGDGDRAYNFAIVNQTLAPGATQKDQLDALSKSMANKGVGPGHIGDMPPEKLPRGKVLYGNSKNYLRDVAETSGKNWSIQDEKLTFVSKKSYLPGERVVLTSKTGMIGTPQQTNEGVNVKCLLNPNIKIGNRIQIDNKSIERYKINLAVPNSAANIPAPLTADGVYYVLVIEHQGDTRGVEWYSSMICLNIDVTTNPINSVQTNYG